MNERMPEVPGMLPLQVLSADISPTSLGIVESSMNMSSINPG
ncbi:hypothetical protein [Nitrosospira multiformis]|nr:hypothetical protein [Nitrosospira multiformis]